MNGRFFEDSLYKSASDADSEGQEGKYFVLSYPTSKKALEDAGLDEKNVKEILKYFNITKYGNFENSTTSPYIDEEKIPKNIEKAKEVLKKLRSKVAYPFIDDKMLTSWNALMASALFEAGVVNPKYSRQGLALVNSILTKLEKNGVLYHQLLLGSTLKVKGLLEDYSFLIDALISANQYTQDDKYLVKATTLLNIALDKFYKDKTWYLSDGDFKSKASLEGASYKSAMAQMIQNTFTLSLLNGDMKLYEKAVDMLANISDKIKNEIRYPYMYILGTHENLLQACSNKECFSFSKNPKVIKEGVKKYLEQK